MKHTAKRWEDALQRAGQREREWRTEAREVVKIYRDEQQKKQRFNIFFSNVQTIKPAVYSATPKADVRRRFRDEDPEGKELSEVLERALSFSIDAQDFDGQIEDAVDDMLIPGRGLVRVRYVPTFETVKVEVNQPLRDEEGEPIIGPDGLELTEIAEIEEDRLVHEEVIPEYVYWEDFRMGPARKWSEVPWIAFKHKFTEEEFEEAFPGKGDLVKFVEQIEADSEEKEPGSDHKGEKLADVWEIWNREDRKVIWHGQNAKDILEVNEDPLNLEHFWPVPRPLYALETTDTMIPRPEFKIYEHLAKDLDEVQIRIQKLTKGMRLSGVYPAQMKEVAELLTAEDNKMIGVTDQQFWTQNGNLDNVIKYRPIDMVANALQILYQNRDRLIESIYEITGISDILRGQSKASETATAQQIKSNFGTLRLDARRAEIQRFARDVLRIMAEVIAEKFQLETLQAMTGQQITERMQEIMRSDILRAYSIDIETDSTIAEDQAQSQQEVTELLSSMVQFMQGVGPMVQSGAVPIETAKDMLLYAVRRFKGGRQIEEAIERIGQENAQNIPLGQGGAQAGGNQQSGAQPGAQQLAQFAQ